MSLHYYQMIKTIERSEVTSLSCNQMWQVMPEPAEDFLPQNEIDLIEKELDESEVFAYGLQQTPGTPLQSEIDDIADWFQKEYRVDLSSVEIALDEDADLYTFLSNYTKSYSPDTPGRVDPFHIQDELAPLIEDSGVKLTAEIEKVVEK